MTKRFGSNPILEGGTSLLTFTISNPNPNDTLSGIAFTDTYPGSLVNANPLTPAVSNTCGGSVVATAGGTGISLSGGTLGGGATCTISLPVTAPSAASYANTSGAVSATTAGTGNTATDTLVVNAPQPKISLRKEISTTSTGPWSKFLSVAPGTSVYYRLTIENTGDVALSPVSVSDPTVTLGCTWPVSLPVASATDDPSATCVTGAVTALSGDNINTATAHGTHSGTTYNSSSSSADYIGATPGFSLLKQISTSATGPWSSSTTVALSGNVYYKFTLVNTGGLPLSPVSITDPSITMTSCTLAASLAVGGATACVVGPITASATAGTFTNTATGHGTTASSTTVDTATSSANYTAGSSNPDLTIAKSHSGSFSQGQVGATYSVTVTNSGSGDKTVSNLVTVTDTAPSGLTITAMSGTGWTCTTLPTCTRSDALAASASYPAITVTVSVASSATTPLVNSVAVSLTGQTESNSGNNSATDSTVIATSLPDLTIAKSHSGSFSQGQVGATYSVTVTNSGSGDKTVSNLVTVTDTAPSGLTITAMSGTGWTCTTLPTCTRSDALAASASYPAITVTVSVASSATTPLVNSVAVSLTGQTESNSGNNSATDSTVIATLPDMAISLAGLPATATVGVAYSGSFTCTNSGTAAASAGTTCTVSGLPAGVSVGSCTVPTSTPWVAGNAVAVGQVVTCTVSGTPTTAGSVTVTGTTGATGDTNAANNTDTKAVVVSAGQVSLSGTVFNDLDGNQLQNGSESGSNAGGLNVVVVDGTGKVLGVAPVSSNGAWSVSVVRGSGYRAYLTTSSPALDTIVSPAIALPSGWVSTGENVGGVADGSPDGILAGIDASSALNGLNFGIRQTQPADMRVTLTGFPLSAKPNTVISGILTCRNDGATAAINATCALVSGGTASNCKVGSAAVTLPVASLAVGKSIVCEVTATTPASGTLTINATTGAGNDSGVTGKTAQQTVLVSSVLPGKIQGAVWYDLNHNGVRDPEEPGRVGWTVELLLNGSVVATSLSASDGSYFFAGLPPAAYTVRFVNPSGLPLGSGPIPVNGDASGNGGTPTRARLDNINVVGGTTVIDQSLPLDPSGAVYDSVTRQPISGATVTLNYNGAPINSAWLAGGTAVQSTDAAGRYAFFLLPAAQAGTYSLSATAAGYDGSPSAIIPATPAPAGFSGGSVGYTGAPPVGQTTTYYLSFPLPTTDITNDNLPLDRGQEVLSGTVFNDLDASKVQNGVEVGTNAAGLNVVVVDASNTVLALTAVQASGTWSLKAPRGSNYTVFVTANMPAVGDTAIPAILLPAGWAVTGENVAGVPDGTADGMFAGINANSSVSDLNFGVRLQALADMRVALSGFPATVGPNTTVSGVMTCTNQGVVAALNASCALTSGATASNCKANGVATSFPVANLAVGASVVCDVTGMAPAAGSLTITAITGASNDSGTIGKTATVIIQVVMPAILSGTVFNDLDASKVQNGAEVGTNAGGLNTVVVDAGNTVLATAIVSASGTWSVPVVPGNGYRIFIKATNAVVGSTLVPTASLPAGWAVTGENVLGTPDGAANGILTVVNVGTAVSGLNFGIRQTPALADMRVVLSGFPLSSTSGGSVTGLMTCTNLGAVTAVNATCALSSVGVLGRCWSGLVDTNLPMAALSVGASVVCQVMATAPASGSMTIRAVTGASNDSGNIGKLDSTIIDVISVAPSLREIPTLSEWGAMLLSLLLACVGSLSLRRNGY